MLDFILLLKIGLVPVLILTASLASDKWGPSISGWFVTFPLTSGPVVFLLALTQGNIFASHSAVGVILGLAAVAGFALSYSLISLRNPNAKWFVSMPVGWVVFFIVGYALMIISFSAIISFFVTAITLTCAIRILYILLKRYSLNQKYQRGAAVQRTSRSEIFIRIVAATFLVFGITQTAPSLGSHLSGVFATFPIYVSVLTASIHHSRGATSSARFVQGALYGLFTPTVFFLVVGFTLVPLGLGISFGLAILASLLMHLVSLRIVKKRYSND